MVNPTTTAPSTTIRPMIAIMAQPSLAWLKYRWDLPIP
jgi:hypothetical protein